MIFLKRFSDRILINNPKTRQLLKTYAKTGLFSAEMVKLQELTKLYAPFLVNLIEHMDKESDPAYHLHQCHPKMKKLLQCIASTSPVCALVPPTKTALNLVQKICNTDITTNPNVSHI